MRFDIKSFLDAQGIHYVTSGRNVAKDHINIKCPACGNADPSEHMGIRLSDGAWGCWRDRDHRGRDIARLIRMILNCSLEEARRIVGRPLFEDDDTTIDDVAREDFYDQTNAAIEHGMEGGVELSMPREFRPLWRDNKRARFRFLRYLHSRGFKHSEVLSVCRLYNLRYCVTGRYADRIIIPITYKGALVTWTSRSIYPNAGLRYLSLSAEDSVVSVKHLVYNYDKAARGGKRLIIVEGPMDVLKLDFYGRSRGVRAVGLISMTMERPQRDMLHKLSKKFAEVCPLLDSSEELGGQMGLESELSFLPNLAYVDIPDYDGDPGSMSRRDIYKHICA